MQYAFKTYFNNLPYLKYDHLKSFSITFDLLRNIYKRYKGIKKYNNLFQNVIYVLRVVIKPQ